MKSIVQSFVVVFLATVLFTWWTLESSGVATLETRRPDGSTRSTHVWFVEPDGELWIEAGTPENGWYRDIQNEKTLAFRVDGPTGSEGAEPGAEEPGRFRAEPIPGAAAHERIRSLLREKYGFRDWWIGLLFETSHSIAVRLVPAEIWRARHDSNVRPSAPQADALSN